MKPPCKCCEFTELRPTFAFSDVERPITYTCLTLHAIVLDGLGFERLGRPKRYPFLP
jgi:hypothetical protein